VLASKLLLILWSFKMSQENVVVESIPKCGCGRSLHMPYCDGSHGRSEAQYAEWKLQTAQEKLQAAKDDE
jgi:CDGSH-type Zn-finger protein